jgi:hypothetical protein
MTQGATTVDPVLSVELAPGNYWVGAIYQATASDYYQAVSGRTVYGLDPQSYSSMLPASLSSSVLNTVNNTVMNFFIVIQDVAE